MRRAGSLRRLHVGGRIRARAVALIACLLLSPAAGAEPDRAGTGPEARATGSSPRHNRSAPGRPGGSAGDLAEQPFVERVDVSLVLVPTVVRDARGKPVTDLRREDFRIFDEGEPQEIAAFGLESRQVSVALALDTSPSMERHRHPVKRAALEFVRRQREETAFSLVTFNEGVFLDLDFTTDRDSMENAIAAARIGGDATALLDTLGATARHLEARGGARVAILFTDGTDTVHPLHEAEARLSAGIEAAVQRDVSAYTVAFGPRAARSLLRRIADETGGEALVAATRDDLAAAFTQIAESVGNRYLLGFKPPEVDSPGFRRIEVQVSRSGLSVVARRRYLAR
jgi:VWFA-related protein